MKRLLRQASVSYKLVGKIHFTSENNQDYNPEDADDKGLEYAKQLKDALKEEMSELGSSGLAQYLDNRDGIEDGVVTSIIVDCEAKGDDVYSVTTVQTSRELSNEEKEALKDYISGQFSDGFGEGFEQHSFAEYRDDYFYEEEGYEDEDGNFWPGESDTIQAKYELYAHLWTPSTTYNWE